MKTKRVRIPIAATLLVLLLTSFAQAESWSPFSKLLDESEYIAQYQEIIRDGKVVRRRLAHVFLEGKGSKAAEAARNDSDLKLSPWTYQEFKTIRGRLVSKFVFYGRGQRLLHLSADEDLIKYPGTTFEEDEFLLDGEPEVVCSPAEFHGILTAAAELKAKGVPTKGRLMLSVFGKQVTAK